MDIQKYNGEYEGYNCHECGGLEYEITIITFEKNTDELYLCDECIKKFKKIFK